MKTAPFTKFGKTVNLPVETHKNCKVIQSDVWDEELWVERNEDMYALMSPGLRNKIVRVVYREWFLKARGDM